MLLAGARLTIYIIQLLTSALNLIRLMFDVLILLLELQISKSDHK